MTVLAKPCEFCGTTMTPKTFPCGLKESPRRFAERRFCDKTCVNAHRRAESEANAEIDDVIRLISKIELEPNGCWRWLGHIDRGGYGLVWMRGKTRIAHRAMYMMLRGPIPNNLTLDHLCRDTRCVNPDHLEPVTAAVNGLRGNTFQGINARKTHCHRGHPLSGPNLRIDRNKGRPSRACRQCEREREASR